jgi:hypothetical protein
VRHATEVEKILSDPRTTFVVVSTLEAAPTHEATYLARAIRRRDLHLGAIIANRALPKSFTTKAAKQSARKLVKIADGPIAAELAADLDVEPAAVTNVLTELGERFDDVAIVAKREAERRSELAELASLLVAVPMLDRDVNDLTDLVEMTGSFGA